jgi:L-ascorbate metabolism protein UlaG (beta-lactamase superfamily)
MILQINKTKFLIDPMLNFAETYDPISNSPNQKRNPLVNLPVKNVELEKLITSVDSILSTHIHNDHFDTYAKKILPKNIPLICQSEDADNLSKENFSNLLPIKNEIIFNDILIKRIGGRHGTGEIGKLMGTVSGYIMEHKDEPSIYITGDTIWCEEVEKAIQENNPDIIIAFGGAAQFLQGGVITMDKNDIYKLCVAAPNSKVIVVHMEALNHCLLKREELKTFCEENNLSDQVIIPDDGQVLIIK